MSTLRDLLVDPPPATASVRTTPIRERGGEQANQAVVAPSASFHDEQIHGLVQQLFLRNESRLIRHVAFAPADGSIAPAALCLDVARALAEECKYDVALIDARIGSAPLHGELQIAAPARVESSWQIAPHLWIVPRQTWLPDSCAGRVNEVTLTRLRDTAAGFDFSIVCCSPVAWLTASIGQTCDGLVLVLAAEKTRRLVAAQIRDQLVKAQVPLLGTVLAGRRLPVPSGLYHRL